MQTGKKCGRCNAQNAPGRAFCAVCGKYLLGKSSGPEKRVTVWGSGAEPAQKPDGDAGRGDVRPSDSAYLAVCPECGSENPAPGQMLPLACSVCGYFFQDGIDRVIRAGDQKTDGKPASAPKNVASAPQKPDAGKAEPDSGPLHRTARDTSSLRLSAISSDSLMPEEMAKAGNVLGKNGTVFKGIQTEQQLSIWHAATGWYARATAGEPLFNGVPMNRGVQIRLSSGDLLVVGQEQFRAEIF